MPTPLRLALLAVALLLAPTAARAGARSAPPQAPATPPAQARDLVVFADDDRATVSLTLSRRVPVTTSVSAKGALVYDFQDVRLPEPRRKERPDSILVYSINVQPSRRTLRVVFNRKQFLPEAAVSVAAGFVASGAGVVWSATLTSHLAEVYPPAPLRTTVVIDPGHGGIDPGHLATGVYESGIVLNIARRLKALMDATPGWRAILTRAHDVYVPLEDRCKLARLVGADAFVSVHCNSFKDDAAINGFEVYRLAERVAKGMEERLEPAEQALFKDVLLDNFRLSESLREGLADASGLRDRGCRPDAMLVTRVTGYPAALVECGFLTSTTEGKLLQTPVLQNKIAGALHQGLLLFAERKKAQWNGPAREPPRSQARRRKKTTDVASTSASSSSSSPSSSSLVRPPLPPGLPTHVVTKGQTLGAIARLYRLASADLAAANGITDPNRIYLGQRLVVPPRPVPVRAAVPTAVATAAAGGR